MSEDYIIKRKLLLDWDGTGETQKIDQFVKHLIKWIYSDEIQNDQKAVYDKLSSEIHHIEQNRIKFELVNRRHTRELIQTHKNIHLFQDKIKLVNEDIRLQRALLKKATSVKTNRFNYDLLALTIKQQPTREKLQEIITKMRKENDELEKEKKCLNTQLKVKLNQCSSLVTSMNELVNDMAISETNDNELAIDN